MCERTWLYVYECVLLKKLRNCTGGLYKVSKRHARNRLSPQGRHTKALLSTGFTDTHRHMLCSRRAVVRISEMRRANILYWATKSVYKCVEGFPL